MVDIPTQEPDSVTAGDLIQWTRSWGNFPATTWTLTYTLINSSAKISLTATATNTTDFLISVPAATSAAWSAGVYKWQAYATNGVQRYTVATGEMTILANFATQTTLDTRSQVKRILDSINAVIEGRASLDQQQYEIQGRKLVRTPIADLIVLRDKYAALYRQEQNADRIARGEAGANRILVRM